MFIRGNSYSYIFMFKYRGMSVSRMGLCVHPYSTHVQIRGNSYSYIFMFKYRGMSVSRMGLWLFCMRHLKTWFIFEKFFSTMCHFC
jgi:hypothetical protein